MTMVHYRFEEVLKEFDLEGRELTYWISQNWVLPSRENPSLEADDTSFLFDQSDLARVKLIAELRRDLEINDDAMPVVLRLLDQVYGLRRTLGELVKALEALPEVHRNALKEIIQAHKEGLDGAEGGQGGAGPR
jgi:chaperone modulatory protein CbpM